MEKTASTMNLVYYPALVENGVSIETAIAATAINRLFRQGKKATAINLSAALGCHYNTARALVKKVREAGLWWEDEVPPSVKRKGQVIPISSEALLRVGGWKNVRSAVVLQQLSHVGSEMQGDPDVVRWISSSQMQKQTKIVERTYLKIRKHLYKLNLIPAIAPVLAAALMMGTPTEAKSAPVEAEVSRVKDVAPFLASSSRLAVSCPYAEEDESGVISPTAFSNSSGEGSEDCSSVSKEPLADSSSSFVFHSFGDGYKEFMSRLEAGETPDEIWEGEEAKRPSLREEELPKEATEESPGQRVPDWQAEYEAVCGYPCEPDPVLMAMTDEEMLEYAEKKLEEKRIAYQAMRQALANNVEESQEPAAGFVQSAPVVEEAGVSKDEEEKAEHPIYHFFYTKNGWKPGEQFVADHGYNGTMKLLAASKKIKKPCHVVELVEEIDGGWENADNGGYWKVRLSEVGWIRTAIEERPIELPGKPGFFVVPAKIFDRRGNSQGQLIWTTPEELEKGYVWGTFKPGRLITGEWWEEFERTGEIAKKGPGGFGLEFTLSTNIFKELGALEDGLERLQCWLADVEATGLKHSLGRQVRAVEEVLASPSIGNADDITYNVYRMIKDLYRVRAVYAYAGVSNHYNSSDFIARKEFVRAYPDNPGAISAAVQFVKEMERSRLPAKDWEKLLVALVDEHLDRPHSARLSSPQAAVNAWARDLVIRVKEVKLWA